MAKNPAYGPLCENLDKLKQELNMRLIAMRQVTIEAVALSRYVPVHGEASVLS